jgi:hypothetical protein
LITYLEELYGYFAGIKTRSKKEENLFLQLHAELPHFPISSVHRDDLANEGFDVSNVTDDQMQTIADKMADAYSEQVFWIDLDIIADYAGVPKKETNRYVLVEFPEEAGYFEENNIGYPCFNGEDNGARYVPEEAYIEHFGHEPQPDSYFQPVRWPQSQEFFGNDDDSIAALCEPIVADEKALSDFGSSAIWAPLCLINQ